MSDKNSSTPITQIMHRHVTTADNSTTAQECAERMSRDHIGCLIIEKKGKAVGIITERSFVNLVKRGPCRPDKIKASDFMASPLITIGDDADFAAAMAVFNKKEIKRLPVVKRGRVVGLLTLRNMIEFSNIALVNLEERHRNLKTKASLDALTGLYNKVSITKALQKEYERILRYGGRSSILFLDLDHFKKINDTWSHLAGDEILKELGALLKKECRNIDVVGRFGGEEFVVLAPNRKKHDAVSFGERLRKAVADHTFSFKGQKIPLTISIGIASLFEGRGYAAALERADKALYYAKNMGRNRVGLWREGKLAIAEEQMG